ncbi:unnamed protein product [Amoebophrya sp. A120]|nr:unnamed protein product [Amoebophrya sp. A120]|eukprot:GSA120T00019101001.1
MEQSSDAPTAHAAVFDATPAAPREHHNSGPTTNTEVGPAIPTIHVSRAPSERISYAPSDVRGVTIADFRDTVYPSNYRMSAMPSEIVHVTSGGAASPGDSGGEELVVDAKTSNTSVALVDQSARETRQVSSRASSTVSSASSGGAGGKKRKPEMPSVAGENLNHVDHVDDAAMDTLGIMDKQPQSPDHTGSEASSGVAADIGLLVKNLHERRDTDLQKMHTECERLRKELEEKNAELEHLRAEKLLSAALSGADGETADFKADLASKAQDQLRELASASAKRISHLEEEKLRARLEGEEIQRSVREQLLELETMRLQVEETEHENQRLLLKVEALEATTVASSDKGHKTSKGTHSTTSPRKKTTSKANGGSPASPDQALRLERLTQRCEKAEELWKQAEKRGATLEAAMLEKEKHHKKFSRKLALLEKENEQLQKRIEKQNRTELLVEDLQKRLDNNYSALAVAQQHNSQSPCDYIVAGSAAAHSAPAARSQSPTSGKNPLWLSTGQLRSPREFIPRDRGRWPENIQQTELLHAEQIKNPENKQYAAILEEKETLQQRLQELQSAKKLKSELEQGEKDASAAATATVSMRTPRDAAVPSFYVSKTPTTAPTSPDEDNNSTKAHDSRLGLYSPDIKSSKRTRFNRKAGFPANCFSTNEPGSSTRACSSAPEQGGPRRRERSNNPTPGFLTTPTARARTPTPTGRGRTKKVPSQERRQQATGSTEMNGPRGRGSSAKKPPFLLGSGRSYSSTPMCSPRGVYGNVVRQELINVPPASVLPSSDYLW